jgi:hypothetical protein
LEVILEEIAMLLIDVVEESRKVSDEDLLMLPRHSQGICKLATTTTRRQSRRSWKKASKLALSTQQSRRFFERIYIASGESEEGNSGKEEEEVKATKRITPTALEGEG